MPVRLALAAVTIDFGNTLVRVDRAGLRAVVEQMVERLALQGLVPDRDGFLTAWAEERERQFREEVPHFREVDIGQRAVRVLARARGMAPPPPDVPWDDLAAASQVEPQEVDAVVDAYSAAFLAGMTPVEDALPTLRGLAERGFGVAILSNWPLAVTVDRFAEANGWGPYLRAIVVSQRVGMIKPHPAIFRAAEEALGVRAGANGRMPILHVGDDWVADVVGASSAGWSTAYLRGRQIDTPLPTSEPGDGAEIHGAGSITADFEIDELRDLDDLVELDHEAAVAVPGSQERHQASRPA